MTSLTDNLKHREFARAWTQHFGETVSIVHCQASEWLKSDSKPIDVLYLGNGEASGSAVGMQALDEVTAAQPRLHAESLVVFDDAPFAKGVFLNRGELAIPWLIDQGWSVLHSGHQTILSQVPV